MVFIPLPKRGTAYGIFNTVLSLSTLASGVIFGLFIDTGYSAIVLVGFALLLQVSAIIALAGQTSLLLHHRNTEIQNCSPSF
jgi:hypothetical protein